MRPTDAGHLAVSTTWFEAALVIFIVVFLVVVGWTLLARPGAFDDVARIPLDDEVVTPKDDERRGDEATKETDP